MDENLQNDRLDEFVNRSFEQYSEDPSDSVWDAIENRLEAPAAVVTTTWKSHIWKYAAVLAILLLTGALIKQHYSHKRQVTELNEKLNSNIDNAVQNSNNSTTEQTNAELNPNELKPADIQTTSGSITKSNLTNKTKYNSSNSNISSENVTAKDTKVTIEKKQDVYKPEDNQLSDNTSSTKVTKPVLNPVDEQKATIPSSDNAIVEEKLIKSDTEVSELASLESPENLESNVFNKDAVSSMVAALPIPSRNFVPNIYASIMAAPTLTYEIRNNDQNFDPMHKGQVNNEQVGAVYSTDLNLRVGANLSDNWGIESGLVYSKMNRVAEHKPQFKFKDHKHGGGGPGGPGGPPDNNSYFDFDYGLNTFGGSTNVEVRVENVDSTYMFNDDDPINLNITTNEKLEILRVPLVGVYKIPMGRFGLILKGGFIGNFLLKNELQITGLNTNDVKLKDKEDNHHQRPSIETPSKFQLGYLFSSGAYYKLSRNISLSAEPYISGNLSTTNCNGFKLPSYYSIGVNTGITYNF